MVSERKKTVIVVAIIVATAAFFGVLVSIIVQLSSIPT